MLCPQYLAFFSAEEHAAVSETGFMFGDADYGKLSTFGNTGAKIDLNNVHSAEPEHGEDKTAFDIVLNARDAEGQQSIKLVTANREIATGWSAAISAQKDNWDSERAPRRKKTGPPPVLPEDALAMAASQAASAAAANLGRSMTGLAAEAKKGGVKGFFASLLGSGSTTGGAGASANGDFVRAASDYVASSYWAERNLDLTSERLQSNLEDEAGNPAAVLFGWATKKNKSGLFAGEAEKDRFFVLTPGSICFFPDERIAALTPTGFMHGKAKGEKIQTSMLGDVTGAKLALESVTEIRQLRHMDESNQARRAAGRGGVTPRFDDSDAAEAAAEAAAKKRAAEAAALAARSGGGGAVKKRGAAKKADDEDEDEDEEADEAVAAARAKAAAAAKVKATAAPNYDAMNEAVLRTLCAKRGSINTDAKPAELRQRLRDDDVAKGRVPKKIAPLPKGAGGGGGGGGGGDDDEEEDEEEEEEEEEVDVDELGKDELVEMCEKLGLDESGKVKELRARITDHRAKQAKAKKAKVAAKVAAKAKKAASAAREAAGESPDWDELDSEQLMAHCKARALAVPKDAKAKALRALLAEDDEKRKAMPPPPDYDAMDKDELKALCKQRGVSSDVKGPELRARLREDDIVRNKEAAAAAAAAAAEAAREEELALEAKAAKASARAAAAAAAAEDDDEDEDEDDEDRAVAKKKKTPVARVPAPKAVVAPRAAAPKAAADDPNSNLIEVDFGEFSLIFNTHNAACRTAWITALRKWVSWRKRKVDEALFGGGGGGGQ